MPYNASALSKRSWSFAAFIALTVSIGCNRSSPPLADERPTDGIAHEAALTEFTAIGQSLLVGKNPYLGRGQIEPLQAEIRNAPTAEKIGLMIELSAHLLRVGESQAATEQMDEAFDLVRSMGRKPSAGMQKARAMVYLRHAEVTNCVNRHHGECCIFPLQGRGIHEDRTAAKEAQKSLLAALEEEPNNLLVQWLLNIASMATSEFPESVPEQFRVPERSLTPRGNVKRFVDVAPRLGVDTYNLCGGVVVEDFDNDGYLDIVTSTYHPTGPLHFYRNEGNGTFSDQTSAAGLDSQLGGLNCLGADYDNDGDVDILVLRGAWLMDDGRIRNSLLRNNGDGTFVDVTSDAGLAEPAYPTQAAAWGDFDNDGDLDLFVGNESRKSLNDPSGDFPSQLFRNNGDGSFTDIAVEAGVTNDRYSKGVTVGDYDNDGDLDIYVSNGGKNRLYRNNANGTFTDVAEAIWLTAPEGRSFASWFFDYDNDGWLDLFVTGYSATPADVLADYRGQRHGATLPCLYHNQGDGKFRNKTIEAGLAHPYLPMGANFGDIDGDGFLDICLATGDPEFETLMPNVMLRNDRGIRFRDVTVASGFGHLQKGHGVAFADFDHDGDQDIYNQLGGFYLGDAYHNALFLNAGGNHHFVLIELVGIRSNRQGVGARIKVELKGASQDVLHRAVGSVSSFGGSPLRQEIGLGTATGIKRITVIWPASGTVQQFDNVPIDEMIRITEGRDDFEVVPRRKLSLSGGMNNEE